MPFTGETLPLSMQLHDGATGKFVRATLRDETGALITPAFALTHIGNGKYTSDAVVMPAGVKYIETTYDVFDDGPFTTPSPEHYSGADVFRFEIPDQIIVDKLDEIIAKLESTLGSLTSVTAVIEQANVIEEVIDTAKELRAELTSEELLVSLDGAELVGIIEDQDEELTATVECSGS